MLRLTLVFYHLGAIYSWAETCNKQWGEQIRRWPSPPIFRFWGTLVSYASSNYIQYNDKLISYNKRISNLLSRAQSILNSRFSFRLIVLANINHHAECFYVHIGRSRNLQRGRILSHLDLSSSPPSPTPSLPSPLPHPLPRVPPPPLPSPLSASSEAGIWGCYPRIIFLFLHCCV